MRMFKPCVVAISGLPLHGKTTVAVHIAKNSNFVLQDVDDFRRLHFPSQSGIALPEQEEIDVMVRSFGFMMESVGELVKESKSILLPSTFSRLVFKNQLVRFVRENPAIPVRIFRLDVRSEKIVQQRLKERLLSGTNSNVKSIERYRWSKGIVEPWPEGTQIIDIDAERSVKDIAESIFVGLCDLEE